MKLRSHGDGASSSKGKPEYIEISDEDDSITVSSDSDYDVLHDECENMSNAIEDNGQGAIALEVVREGEMLDHDRALEVAQEEGERELNANIIAGRKKKKKKPTLLWEVWEQENERWIAENSTRDIDLSNQNEMSCDILEPPSDLIMPLLRYQKEWLAWSVKQEASAMRGGILADEMGMGKTIQAISLVLTKREINLAIPRTELPSYIIKGTLVVCPLAAAMQWVSEIERCTARGSTKVLLYHGVKREKNFYRISEYDFVITTYRALVTDYKKYLIPTEKCSKSILHSVKWDRIILDEAHDIKDRRRIKARAVFALQSSYKWALSGTPSRIILMISTHFAQGECPYCQHKTRHFCWWVKYISSRLKKRDRKDVLILLTHKILKSIVLRRTKKSRAADLALPHRTVIVKRYTLDVVEEDYYTALYKKSRAQFNTYLEAGTLMNNYAHVFVHLTRLQQAVDHPYLVQYSLSEMKRKGKEVDASNGEQCGLCQDLVQDPVVTSCAHMFCKSCLIEYSANMGQGSCPLCSKPLTVDFTDKDSKEQNASTILGFKSSSILNRIQLEAFRTSTKIEALREEIRDMIERDGSAKGIVFSLFTSFLDLIQYSLQQSGVNCARYDGSMSLGARDASIERFNEDPDCGIFLMSLKAGGVALNLTVASNVFLMDPWWNPALEQQAQDRIYRIGQYKPIRIVKFIIENTVEEKILKLQELKELMFLGTVGGFSEALGKLQLSDFMFLFE